MSARNGQLGLMPNFIRSTTIPVYLKVVDANNSVVDLTGAKLYVRLSANIDGTSPVLDVTIDPASDPTTGYFQGSISDSTTQAVAAGTYYYEIRYIDSGDVSYALDQGKVKCYETMIDKVEQ